MTLEQLMVRLEQQRLNYAYILADLRAAGEPIVAATAEQIVLAELAGFVVNLQSGHISYIPGYRPKWIEEVVDQATTRVPLPPSAIKAG